MLAKLKRLGWFATVAALMGSGTVLVAAELQGKQGTGIECVPEYFDIACRHVKEAVRKREADAAQLTLATGTA